MTHFVYQLIRQAKIFCIVLMKTLEYQNVFFLFFFFLPFFGIINISHCFTLQNKSLLGREKYAKCWLLIQGITVAKQVA